MLKMYIDNEEVVSKNDFTIKEEMLSASSTILNNTYPKSWEDDKDYTSRFYYPKDYAKLNIQNFSIEPEEAGTTIQVNGSATLTDVDTTKESRVLKLLGQTSQTGTPTPSSPIPINVVSGDNEINICGKNLLPYPYYETTKTTNGVTYTDNGNGTISINGTATANAYFSIFPNTTGVRLKFKAGTYTFSNNVLLPSGVVITFNPRDSSGNAISGVSAVYLNDTTKEATRTINQDFELFANILVSSGTAITTLFTIYPQIEKSNQATTYEPYVGSSYPIYLGAYNLFDKDNAPTRIYGYLMDNLTTWAYASGGYSIRIPCQPNTKYSLIADNSNETIFRAGITDSDNTPVSGTTISVYSVSRYTNTNTPIYLTSGANAKYIVIQVGVDTASNTFNTLELTKGATPQHISTTPIELCKIGTYQDYIYKDNGVWYLHKEIGKVVLDGSETGLANLDANHRSNITYTNLGITPKAYSSDCLSNYFIYANTEQYIGFNLGGSALYLRIDNSFTNITQFKNWLSTYKPVFYLLLATPTTTEITDTTLLEQLDALESS